jgi:hypothetical protein
MGLRLPIYPYYAAQGKPKCRKDSQSEYNKRAHSSLQQFQRYLSLPEVKKLADNIIPGSLDPKTDNWFRPCEFEEDDATQPVLIHLLNMVGRHGTILIPDITHITGKKNTRLPITELKKLVRQIESNNIEILPLMLKLKNERCDLRKLSAPALFELMPKLAMETTEYLKRSVMGGAPVRQKRKAL